MRLKKKIAGQKVSTHAHATHNKKTSTKQPRPPLPGPCSSIRDKNFLSPHDDQAAAVHFLLPRLRHASRMGLNGVLPNIKGIRKYGSLELAVKDLRDNFGDGCLYDLSLELYRHGFHLGRTIDDITRIAAVRPGARILAASALA